MPSGPIPGFATFDPDDKLLHHNNDRLTAFVTLLHHNNGNSQFHDLKNQKSTASCWENASA